MSVSPELTEREAISKIRTMVFAVGECSPDLYMQRRTDSPNPFYRQTSSGLFLEIYYGMPSTLWTPWGKLEIGGSGHGNWDSAVATILPRLGAVAHAPLTSTAMGEFGPVYALTRVDGSELPEPVLRHRSEFLSYENALAAWTSGGER